MATLIDRVVDTQKIVDSMSKLNHSKRQDMFLKLMSKSKPKYRNATIWQEMRKTGQNYLILSLKKFNH